MAIELPPTMKALIQEKQYAPLVVKQHPTPKLTPGSAIVRIVSAPVVSYMREAYDGTRPYQYPTPLVTGTSAIGRIAALGSDAVKLEIGDLVYFDCTLHGRDDNTAIALMGFSEGGTKSSKKLLHGEWRDSTFAEYARLPLENLYVLNEQRFFKELGYSVDQLNFLLQGLIPFGGLRSIGLEAGETIIISPATGGFGSAAVVVALAMGARVIAMGRNEESLAKVKAINPSRVDTVTMKNDMAAEMEQLKKFGRITAFFDISPSAAQHSTHFKSSILSLAHGGRVSLMGGLLEDLPLPHRFIMRFDITLKGKWMYGRDDVFAFLGMAESGLFNLNDFIKVRGTFPLEQWKEAFDLAFEQGRLGDVVALHP